MLHSAESLGELEEDLAELGKQHDAECDEAAAIKKVAIGRVLREQAVALLYDQYTEEDTRAQLRQLCTGRIPSTPIDIAHAHQLVERSYTGLLDKLCSDVQRTVDELVTVQKGYVRSVLQPKLRERYQDFVREDHHMMCHRLSQRIAFVEHEFQTRAASIANREGRFFSLHVADLLRQVATSHQRAVDAEAAAGIPTGSSLLPYNALAENQTEAAQLERNVLDSLNPDSLRELSNQEAKAMLVSAQQRERMLWTTVDKLQEIVRVTAVQEEERRAEFQQKLTAELGAQAQALQARNEELTSELTRSRLETVEAVRERDDAYIMAYKLDEMCSKLNLELTGLFRVAKEQGVVSGEFSRIEEQLKKLEARSCTGEPLAVPPEWKADEAPGTRKLLQKLRNNPITVPDPTTLRQQQDMLRGVLDYYEVRDENAHLREMVEASERRIADGKKQLVDAHFKHEQERRRLNDEYSGSLHRLKQEHSAMRKKATDAVVAAASSSTRSIACSDPVVDDLTRKLAAREQRIRELEMQAHVVQTRRREGSDEKGCGAEDDKDRNEEGHQQDADQDASRPQSARTVADIKKYLEADLQGGKLRAMYASTDAVTRSLPQKLRGSPRATGSSPRASRPTSGSIVNRDPHGAQLKAAYQSMCKTPRPPSGKR